MFEFWEGVSFGGIRNLVKNFENGGGGADGNRRR